MGHPLEGAWLRVGRADGHLAEAERIADDFGKACIAGIVANDDGKTVRFDKWPDVPPILSVVVGDALYNLRAALDYLVYELAREDSGKVCDGTQFPIEDIKSDPQNPKRGFDGKRKTFLNGLNAAHVDEIESLQPYRGVEWTKTLRDLSNPDKHRHLVALAHEGRKIDVGLVVTPSGRFYSGKIAYTDDGSPFSERYDFEGDAYHTIAIAGSDPSAPALLPTLRRIESRVMQLIEAFKAEFRT